MAQSLSFSTDNLRIVLVGKTGTGKSKAGNAILDRSGYFAYGSETSSITKLCKLGTCNRFWKHIIVVDTPGVFDTNESNEKTQQEIKRCIGMTAPGPHAILLCVRMGRFTEQDCETLRHFLRYFGQELFKYVIVVFTHCDQWKLDQEENNKRETEEEYIGNLQDKMKDFLHKCSNRYLLFNGRSSGPDNEKQITRLFGLVNEVLKANDNSCYTNKEYEIAAEIFNKEITMNPDKEEDEIRDSDSFLEKIVAALGIIAFKAIQLFSNEIFCCF